MFGHARSIDGASDVVWCGKGGQPECQADAVTCGKSGAIAPHWKSPDNIKHLMRAEIPMWMISAIFGLLGIVGYASLSWMLARHTNTVLGGYFDIVKLAPKVAYILISLP